MIDGLSCGRLSLVVSLSLGGARTIHCAVGPEVEVVDDGDLSVEVGMQPEEAKQKIPQSVGRSGWHNNVIRGFIHSYKRDLGLIHCFS
ncbi:hypothetical protein B0J18DRAFT_439851 [Chaetomium sp. MPI-SDFR-AT-0129]|nr:hypothetical protein B0J18DRAFT_439851 [Chaetomium sp. MPI-SDFR-AT-0129]